MKIISRITQTLVLCLIVSGTWAQGRLILNNGGKVVLNGGVYLVVANSAPNAITRNTSGHIISESENNIVRWNIGTNSASYIVPFGYSTTDYIPVSLTTSSASGSSGYFDFSTYHTDWNNISQLPSGMMTIAGSTGVDNSAFVLDRFWSVSAEGYTVKPLVTNLQFTYLQSELASSNSITENNLRAQRYNDIADKWGDYLPAGSVNTSSNTVTIASVAPADLFGWWTLVDMAAPLPIRLISFTAEPVDQTVALDWATATEINNDFFTIQRSTDGIEFTDIATVPAGEQGNRIQKYSYIDDGALSGRSYYRLKQTDFDGISDFSDIRMIDLEEFQARLTTYPNPTTNGQFSLDFQGALDATTSVAVYNMMGKVVYSDIINEGVRTYAINLDNPPTGVYVVKTFNSKSTQQQSVIIK